MLKVRTLFSGIGSPEIALRELQIPFELIDFCEVDKHAVKSYCAVHGVRPEKNLGDITKVWGRNLPYADLLVWGFPCTDISVAGKQAGIIEGETRSGLYYEGLRILKETKPKYSVIENVKNLTGKKFKAEFEQILKDIEGLGYNNYWEVLNAKDYGIPQNRERVFIISIRKDIDTKTFKFPKGFDNGLRLKDFLVNEVDEKYYISKEKTEKLITQLKDKVIVKEATKKGYAEAVEGDSINLEQPTSQTRRGRVGHQQANTLTCSCNQAVVMLCITPNRVKKRQNGRRFKEDGEPMFTLTSQDRHGILIDHGKLRIKSDVANCLCANYHKGLDNHGQRTGILTQEVVKEVPMPELVGGIGEINFGKQYRQGNRVYSSEKTAMCLMAQPIGNAGGYSYLYNVGYRIRKLTPKECWRLMGFKDEDFQRAKDAGVSDSQLYKQAGNSIVTNCLFYIFKNLLQAEITAIYEENKELIQHR